MIENPVLTWLKAKEYRKDRLRETENERLIRKVKVGYSKLQGRPLLAISEALVSLGLWLRARYQPSQAS
jgi:hypothetical protein